MSDTSGGTPEADQSCSAAGVLRKSGGADVEASALREAPERDAAAGCAVPAVAGLLMGRLLAALRGSNAKLCCAGVAGAIPVWTELLAVLFARSNCLKHQ